MLQLGGTGLYVDSKLRTWLVSVEEEGDAPDFHVVFPQLNETVKEVGLKINGKGKKFMIQSRSAKMAKPYNGRL